MHHSAMSINVVTSSSYPPKSKLWIKEIISVVRKSYIHYRGRALKDLSASMKPHASAWIDDFVGSVRSSKGGEERRLTFRFVKAQFKLTLSSLRVAVVVREDVRVKTWELDDPRCRPSHPGT